ncbi:MAG: site-2 protease family protein [Acidobacteriia bacterium]|nr:site-2 protease family protein [Terriglobia bacterium]
MPPKPGLQIARIFGIPIYLHASWAIIFVLITLSLFAQYNQQHPQWGDEKQWVTGILTSLLFFSSVLFHELAHSVIALRYKIPVVSITLFVFGGIARIGREPSRALHEFNIAIAGPLASFFLFGAFSAALYLFPNNEVVVAVAGWLAQMNLMLAVFNLIPGFPLDGGRIFRAIVWGITKNFVRATRVAATSGKLIAYALILSGALIIAGAWPPLKGRWEAGLWLAFIGWFLLTAAQESVAQITIRETLGGLRARDVMSNEIPTVGREITLQDYGAEALRTGRRCHLVIADDRLLGMMNVHTLNAVPREEWDSTSVQAAMLPRESILLAMADEPLLGLLERLLSADVNQMPVMATDEEGGTHIVGMVSRDSILRVIQTRSELGRLNGG